MKGVSFLIGVVLVHSRVEKLGIVLQDCQQGRSLLVVTDLPQKLPSAHCRDEVLLAVLPIFTG
jgi:hypothetical protein